LLHRHVIDETRQSCTNLVLSIKSEGALISHLRTVTNTCKKCNPPRLCFKFSK